MIPIPKSAMDHGIRFPLAEYHETLQSGYSINVGRVLTFLRPDICRSRSEGFPTNAARLGVVIWSLPRDARGNLDTPLYAAVDKGNTDVMHKSDICKMSFTSADTYETRKWPRGCRAVKPAIVMSMAIRQAVDAVQ